jgi:hypothetical protein
VQVLREAAERADALHNQQRKEDTATFQANLRRLLSEKATLLEEIELVAGQKDALTEALVKANHSLETSRIATEEAEAYKQQHREAAERLQAGLAERDAAKLTAQHHKQQTANLQQQLSAAQQAIASQAVGVDALRTQLEASQQLGDEAKRAAQRGAVRSRRLEASMLCLCAEIRGLEQACDAAERAAASAGARERCHVGVCVAEVAHAEATASKALELARQAAAESASAKAQCSTATTEREQSARATSEAEQSREAAVAALTAERDRALGELAAQRRVADSLRLELKKAMNAMKAGGAGAGGAGAQPGGGAG